MEIEIEVKGKKEIIKIDEATILGQHQTDYMVAFSNAQKDGLKSGTDFFLYQDKLSAELTGKTVEWLNGLPLSEKEKIQRAIQRRLMGSKQEKN